MDFKSYFQHVNLKKVPKVGIHFEQKTTPDLIWCVALVILDITKTDHACVFTDKDDVRTSALFNELMQDYFSKPPQSEAENEYNKVSSYQLGVLEYAGLVESVGTSPKRYKVVDRGALEFIGINDLNASKFLTEYTEKLLIDNGLWDVFDRYRNNPAQDNYQACKESYWSWARANTAVKGTDPKHSFRVYNKIFNILCYKYRLPGQYLSNVTDGVCPYSFLIYNRDNFRDQDMPPGMTRQAYRDNVLSEIDREGVVETLITKAKASVSRKYDGESELRDPDLGYIANNGVHVHHILPKHSYPEYTLARENLIALTPGQHLSYAHIRGNTRTIAPKYQAICLQKKLEHIVQSINLGEDFYNYGIFVDVVNTCYGWEFEQDADVSAVAKALDAKIQLV